MMNSGHVKKRLENPADFFLDAPESAAHFFARNRSATMSKAYRNGVLWLHFHISGEFGKHCIVLKRHVAVDFEPRHPATRVCRGEGVCLTSDNSNGERDDIVLVGVVQFMKKPKGVLPSEIPSAAWLRPLDDCLIRQGQVVNSLSPLLGEAADEAVVAGALTNCCSTRKNRKLNKFGPRGTLKGKPEDGDVECRSKIVGDLADPNTPSRIRESGDRQAREFVGCINVVFEDNTIRFQVPEAIKLPVQLLDFIVSDKELEDGAV
jgi:hypothetical protein